MANFFWHNLEVEEVAKILRTNSEDGLSEEEVKLYRKEFGKNELPEKESLSKLKIFLEQFKSPLIYILLISGVVVLFLKETTDAIVIFGALFLNTLVGYVQESKASEALKKLKKAVTHKVEVLRGQSLKIIDSKDVVPGDVVILNPGDRVPADGRIIESSNLKINEMALTGEWLSAEKEVTVLPKKTPLADRDNMVYMGTVVEDGKAKVLVVQTGIETQIGKIAVLVKESEEEKTPYQKKLANFSKTIGIAIGVLCIALFIEGILNGKDMTEMFITSVAVAIAAIPEGLPVAMTVILALGMQRILKKGGLVRRLSSAETLGSTSIICTDKTGTLTEGKMKVSQTVTADEVLDNQHNEEATILNIKIASLVSEAFVENLSSPREEWVLRGRATDKALLMEGLEKGVIDPLNKAIKKIAEVPFNTIDKFIIAALREKKEEFLYICGAPEKVLERCQFVKINGKKLPITDEYIKKLEEKLKRFTRKGLRVVATAYKDFEFKDEKKLKTEVNNLTLGGFITLKDTLRKEAKEAIKDCHRAGIRTIIVTGDHKLTAKAVAEEIGFKINKENILEGKDMDDLSDIEFEKILDRTKIYARVEPRHKLRIVQAWQDRGEVVAMTGDGINDAPALKKADVGVALGSGTEVAKEASDLILLNNNFSIIVHAIKEGRAIIDNIRKVITYLLSDSFTELILIGASIFAGFPLPLTAIQILWVNLIEDGLPSTALAFEKEEEGLMDMKPAAHKVKLLTREMKTIIILIGIITDAMLLGLFFWLTYHDHNILHIRTMIFACLSIDSIFYVFSCKSLRHNIWDINPFSNKLLTVSWVVGILALFMAIYLPFLQTILKTVPLNIQDWGLIFILGLTEMFLIEITKWYFIVRHQTEI